MDSRKPTEAPDGDWFWSGRAAGGEMPFGTVWQDARKARLERARRLARDPDYPPRSVVVATARCILLGAGV